MLLSVTEVSISACSLSRPNTRHPGVSVKSNSIQTTHTFFVVSGVSKKKVWRFFVCWGGRCNKAPFIKGLLVSESFVMEHLLLIYRFIIDRGF